MGPRPSSPAVHLRGAVIGVGAAALALLGAACGSSAPTGRAAVAAGPLLQQSAAAVAGEPTVHIKGSVTEKASSTTVSIAVDATSAGKSGTSAGTLDLEGPGLGFSGFTRYIVIGGTTYVNAGTPFWKSLFGTQTSAVVQLENEILPEVLNRWVQLSASSTDTVYKDTFGLSEPKVFVDGSLAGAKGTLTNAGDQTINGVSGVEISSDRGAKILLASTGTPLPLAFANTQSGSTSFGLNLVVTYPTGVTISAPPHAVSLAAIEAAVAK